MALNPNTAISKYCIGFISFILLFVTIISINIHSSQNACIHIDQSIAFFKAVMFVGLLTDSLSCELGKENKISHNIDWVRTRFRLVDLGLTILQESCDVIPPIVRNSLREKIYHCVLDYFR